MNTEQLNPRLHLYKKKVYTQNGAPDSADRQRLGSMFQILYDQVRMVPKSSFEILRLRICYKIASVLS